MKILRWLWKHSIWGMSDEDFAKLKHSRGPNLDSLIEKYNIDVWLIGIVPAIYLGIRLYDWLYSK